MSPTTPGRYCGTCGRGTIHKSGQRCPMSIAREKAERAKYEKSRPSSHERMGPHWPQIRGAWFKAHPGARCVWCGVPVGIRGGELDHIDQNHANSKWDNLRPMCHSCHSRRTGRDQAWGRKGR